jgi:PAS domain S-box-containing protein
MPSTAVLITSILPTEPGLSTKEAAVSEILRRGPTITTRPLIEATDGQAGRSADETSPLPTDPLAVMPAAIDGMAVHRNGVILEVNAAFAEMFGFADPAAVPGTPILDLVAPEARRRVAVLIAEPPSEVLEYDCLRLDGRPILVRGVGTDVDFEGRPARLTVMTDVTRDGSTADRLHQASEFFRLAFDGAPTAKALVSPEGRILYVNPALCELVGFPSDELLQMSYNDLSHTDDREAGTLYAIALLEGKDPGAYKVEKRFVHAQGHVIWVQISVALVRTRSGDPRYFVTQLEDVTARKDAEDALRTETERLRLLQAVAVAANSSEDPAEAYATALREVCEHTGWSIAHVYHRADGSDLLEPSGIWHVVDDDDRFGTFVEATKYTTLLPGMGLPGLAMAAGRPTFVTIPDGVATPRRDPALAAGIRAAVALPVFANNEIVAILEFFSTELEVPDDALLELLGNVGTQIGRVAARAAARAQALALDDARSRFVANAAHELRTPLATLRTVAGLLGTRRAQMTDDEVAECCELLERQGSNLDALVDDLLDLTRIQQANDDRIRRPVDVGAWVDRALEIARPPEGVTVHRTVGDGLCVLGDADRLNRALVNLLANAYRHGGPTVTVRAERTGVEVVVMVEDDGDGVPDALVADLFEPFTRATGSGGAGLGLAITRALVEQAGGTVSYQASSDQGARFVVRLRECG